MPQYLVLADIHSPEPLLVKVSAASHNDAEFLAMRALDIPDKSWILGVWALDDVEDVRNLLSPPGWTVGDTFRRKGNVPVRRHVRRR